jgi:drug/metabolite transporter (DMT)-like permease
MRRDAVPQHCIGERLNDAEAVDPPRHPDRQALCEATMVVLFVAALPHVIFADVTAVFLSSSLLSAALVAMIGFERVPLSNWLVLLVGFGGVAMVVRPTFEAVNVGAVFAYLAASMIAVRDLITRKVDPSIPTIVVTFATAVTVTIMGFCLMPFGDPWQGLSLHHAGLVLGAGIVVGAANFLGVYAYRKADISVVGPFRYVGLPYAIVAAYLVWVEMPDLWSIAGGLVISGTSIIAIWMQRGSRGSSRS